MKLAVLPVFCKDVPRVTTLTRDWIHRAIGHVAGYYLQQSGLRENMEFRVFDWFRLDLTSVEWNNAGFAIGDTVRPAVAAGLNVDLSPYDRFAIVIDKFDARLGVRPPGRPEVLLGAQSLDPALIAHEFGHLYGANHANLDSPTGPIEYGDNFCVMGGEGSKFSFVHAPLNFTDASGAVITAFSDSGPGMIVPSLLSCGWLDLTQHGVDIGPSLRMHPWENVVELAPLRGAPTPGQPGRPVFAWADGVADQRLTIEFRWRDGYDRAIPDPGSGGIGWVVVHLTGGSGGGATSVQVAVLPTVANATSFVGRGAFRVTVAALDPVRGTVILRTAREAWRPWFIPRAEQSFNRLVPVAAVAREREHLDVFKVGRDRAVWSTWWHGDGDPAGWRPWFPIHPETVFAQDMPVTALARRSDHLDPILFT